MVLVEMGAWALIVIFWLWLMDRGIFVHRWCGCSDNAVLAAILLLLITGIITQFLLFYVVSSLLKSCPISRAWDRSRDMEWYFLCW